VLRSEIAIYWTSNGPALDQNFSTCSATCSVQLRSGPLLAFRNKLRVDVHGSETTTVVRCGMPHLSLHGFRISASLVPSMSRMRWGALIICCPVDTFCCWAYSFQMLLAPVLGIVVIPASSCILANTASLNDFLVSPSRVFRMFFESRRMLASPRWTRTRHSAAAGSG